MNVNLLRDVLQNAIRRIFVVNFRILKQTFPSTNSAMSECTINKFVNVTSSDVWKYAIKKNMQY